MGEIGKRERETQDRVVALFCDKLDYNYLGDWSERPNNRNVEKALLRTWLTRRGYAEAQIARALDVLSCDLGHTGRDLYHDN
jgi:type I restriction enzyme R subunit